MKRKVTLCISIACALMLCACGRNNQSKETATGQAGKEQAAKLPKFTPPEIPVMMQDSTQRLAYYTKHFWDNYPFADTAFVKHDATEVIFAEYTKVLQMNPLETMTKALHAMLAAAEANATAYDRFCALCDKFYYDPNSPFRNEDCYMAVLEQMLKSPCLTEEEKIAPADRLKQALKNRPGMKAANFSYMDPQGKKGTLHALQTPFTLLFFYEPDCSNCKQAESRMGNNPVLAKAIQAGKLKVLAVYSGPETEEWERQAPHMPQNWLVGHDRNEDIVLKGLYDIKATPTLYLLDGKKQVILKDATEESVLEYCKSI